MREINDRTANFEKRDVFLFQTIVFFLQIALVLTSKSVYTTLLEYGELLPLKRCQQ